MTSWSNSVEDPEKHFLGNLLDDDTSFSTSSPSRVFGETVSPSGIPTASVINGVGPISSSQNGPSPFWPEPPPPYTPAVQSPLPSWTFPNSPPGLPSSLHSGILKEPSEWNFFSNDSFLPTTTVQQKSSGTTEIHHHHQHTHQHTHVLQVINKHPYESQSSTQFSTAPLQPFASVAKKATKTAKDVQRPVQLPPHSAPVVNKMPFSYRDVAARKDTNSGGHSPNQQNRIVALSPNGDAKLARSSEAISADSEENNSASKDSKKVDCEFQKISRKKGPKEKRAMSDSSAPLPSKEATPPVVDVNTRYQVLENLSSPKIVKTESVESDDGAFAAKVEKLDEHSPPRPKRVDAKKKNQPQPAKKRGSRKKNDSENWLIRLILTFSMVVMEAIQDAGKWLMTLIVDVCSKMTDITLFGFFTVWDAFSDRIRRVLVSILSYFISSFVSLRHTSLRQFFAAPPPEPTWGLDENLFLPSTTDEALERLLRIGKVDAYAALGLRADCSDLDIQRHRSRLLDLFNPDDTNLEGIEEAEAVLRSAINLIDTPEKRKNYKLNNLTKIPGHVDLMDKWEVLRTKIEEARHTMQCDCGRRHARIPTNIRAVEGRFCKRCDFRHPARTNDMWVETRLFGLAWVYYTCAEGVVYDITEWATCETNYLKHMRPNAHSVQYRLVSPASYMDRNNTSQPNCVPDLLEETWSTRSSAQVSFRPLEPQEFDRSRRAAIRRQKRR